MLEEAVRLVFPGSRCAALCEWEAYAASTLLARMADASLEQAPVWCGDLRDFNATGFRGLVDILTAGLPCQPYSCAGKKQGNTDARSWGEDGDGPIPGFLRIVGECRPAVVFLENVPTWVRAGWFRPVGDELCRMGYEIVEPVFLAAGDVGASHQRERVFILAHAKHEQQHGSGRAWRRWTGFENGHFKMDNAAGARCNGTGTGPVADERGGQCVPGAGCADVAHADEQRCGETGERAGGCNAGESGGELAHAAGVRFQGRRGEHAGERLSGSHSGELAQPAQRGLGELRESSAVANAGSAGISFRTGNRTPSSTEASGGTIFPPGPDAFQWQTILTRNPHLAPAVESGFRVLADGLAVVVDEARADQLRCVGNGVVPLCAAVALVELLRRAKLI